MDRLAQMFIKFDKYCCGSQKSVVYEVHNILSSGMERSLSPVEKPDKGIWEIWIHNFYGIYCSSLIGLSTLRFGGAMHKWTMNTNPERRHLRIWEAHRLAWEMERVSVCLDFTSLGFVIWYQMDLSESEKLRALTFLTLHCSSSPK